MLPSKEATENSPEASKNSAVSEKVTVKATLDTAVQQPISEEGKLVGDCDANSWQTECLYPASRLGAILARGLWFDCEVIVGSKAESVQAHRIILASASPVLAKMLDSNSGLPIVLCNIGLETFKTVQQYIYADNIEITSCESACSIYDAAHFLILPGLEAKVKNYFVRQVSAKCVIQIYELAKKYNIIEIEEICLKVIKSNLQEILMGTELLMARADTLECMFEFETLNISSELLLFKAAERWVRARTETKLSTNHNHDNNGGMGGGDAQTVIANDGEKGSAIRFIKNALQKIRFLTLKPKELAEYDTTSLLTRSEIAAIALNLYSLKAYMPMPIGFSIDRNNRCNRINVYKVTVDFEKQEHPVTPLIGDMIKWSIFIKKRYDNNPYSNKNKKFFEVVLYCDLNDYATFGNECFEWTCEADVELSVLAIEGNKKKYLLGKLKHQFNYDEGFVVTENLQMDILSSDYIRDNKGTLELKVKEPILKKENNENRDNAL